MANHTTLIDTINALSTFGRVKPEDVDSYSSEEREKEEKCKRERKRVEELRRKQVLKQEKEESEYKEYVRQQERDRLRKHEAPIYVTPNKVGRGRAAAYNRGSYSADKMTTGRGRGRLFRENGFFQREQNVQHNLDKLSNANFHNNSKQKMYWTELQTSQDDENEKKFFNNASEPSITSDQYEDADLIQTTSPSFYTASTLSASPLLLAGLQEQYVDDTPLPSCPKGTAPSMHPQVSAQSARPRKPRGSRLAAKFSNSFECEREHDSEEKQKPAEETVAVGTANGMEESREDPLAVCATVRASIYRFKGSRDVENTFDGLKSSRRVLSNDLLDAKSILNAPVSNDNEYSYDKNDFPPL